SFYTVLKSMGIGLAAGLVIGLLFAGAMEPSLLSMSTYVGGPSSFIYSVVAVIAGFAAAFAMTKPHLNDTLPGVAIAVALVPPLASAGIGLSILDLEMFSGAILLFLVNVIGIMFSSMVVFAMFNFSLKKQVASRAVEADEAAIESEKQA